MPEQESMLYYSASLMQIIFYVTTVSVKTNSGLIPLVVYVDINSNSPKYETMKYDTFKAEFKRLTFNFQRDTTGKVSAALVL